MFVTFVAEERCNSHSRLHFVLNEFPALIGRAPGAAVRLDDRWVSRRHCQVDVSGDEVLIRDLDSTHGTFVNGEPVHEARLHEGDTLTVGLCSFVARIAESEDELQTAEAISSPTSAA